MITVPSFTPKMAECGKGGHVVNVSSMLGFNVAGHRRLFDKFGVLGLSMCMRSDLLEHSIGVSAICPGIINTNIAKTARIKGHDNAEQLRDKVVRFYGKRNYSPEKVARAIVKAIKRNKAIVPVSPESWFGILIASGRGQSRVLELGDKADREIGEAGNVRQVKTSGRQTNTALSARVYGLALAAALKRHAIP